MSLRLRAVSCGLREDPPGLGLRRRRRLSRPLGAPGIQLRRRRAKVSPRGEFRRNTRVRWILLRSPSLSGRRAGSLTVMLRRRLRRRVATGMMKVAHSPTRTSSNLVAHRRPLARLNVDERLMAALAQSPALAAVKPVVERRNIALCAIRLMELWSRPGRHSKFPSRV